jgi:hypothetical protein
MAEFFNEFYKSVLPMPRSTAKVLVECGEYIWIYLGVQDMIKLSILSQFMANIPLRCTSAYMLLSRNTAGLPAATSNIVFSQESLTMGWFRFQLKNIRSETLIRRSAEGLESDDAVFKSKCKQLLASFEQSLQVGPSNENEKIQKFLEVASYDEYDDFNPRHPQPKDKTHRRGDSYFNSDIEAHAQAVSIDLQSIANLALNMENTNLDDL